jgi:6,7-dimethyl-8-ribityllumazine synthase
MTNIAAVCATYHLEEIERMLTIATSQAEDLGYNITEVIRVPGCMEIPLALDRVLAHEDIDGAFCLGIIEKGQTDHGLVMGQGVVKTILELQLVHNKPIGLGIIGPWCASRTRWSSNWTSCNSRSGCPTSFFR